MPRYKNNVRLADITIPVKRDVNGLNSDESCNVTIIQVKAISYSVEERFMYSSHSIGSECFFLLLHSLQAGTRLPFVDLPPRMTGIIWSMVRSLDITVVPQ